MFQATYFQAYQYCRYHGMQLVTISSQAENDFLERELEKLGKHSFWTSGSKLSDENNWSWMSTGNPITYINWYPGEPNNVKDDKEDCIEMRSLDDKGLKWNDAGCSNRFNFICERFWSRNCSDLIAELNKKVYNIKVYYKVGF
ncbi:hypothetical protein NQ317_001943 [Molorchus minor]|uniref:C-type lectin domain-containing protein n=1 Tax=Molorchus minor TaxID=1323400 RepID=A0ABQ9JBQ6_9CUCU|nr:hypothetical protein NQ317_001943 [Molorchus minor]